MPDHVIENDRELLGPLDTDSELEERDIKAALFG